jgi:prepilin-type N-terminal cleavage/methylation domain-containing protein
MKKRKIAGGGFTLIEILVVLGILGGLLAGAWVALDGARARGRNANRAAIASRYANALDLFFVDQGNYPVTSSDGYCLGLVDTESCFARADGSVYGSSTLNTALSFYIKPTPFTEPIGSLAGMTGGLRYQYISRDKTYNLVWYAEGFDANCGSNAVPRPDSTRGLTECTITLNDYKRD